MVSLIRRARPWNSRDDSLIQKGTTVEDGIEDNGGSGRDAAPATIVPIPRIARQAAGVALERTSKYDFEAG